jgi:hypothetical protein
MEIFRDRTVQAGERVRNRSGRTTEARHGGYKCQQAERKLALTLRHSNDKPTTEGVNGQPVVNSVSCDIVLLCVNVFLLCIVLFIVLVFLYTNRFFHACSSVVRQMPGYNSQRRGTASRFPRWRRRRKRLCVLRFEVSRSVITVQHEFCAQFRTAGSD